MVAAARQPPVLSQKLCVCSLLPIPRMLGICQTLIRTPNSPPPPASYSNWRRSGSDVLGTVARTNSPNPPACYSYLPTSPSSRARFRRPKMFIARQVEPRARVAPQH